MKWYNRFIFKKLGNRLLLTEEEFRQHMLVEFRAGSLRVITRRQHELLLDIAATADAIQKKVNTGSPIAYRYDVDLIRRLQSALMSYKIVEQDDPHSANKIDEVHLMDIP